MTHYEVELAVERAMADEYLRWLVAHMREILALPSFLAAELLEEDTPADAPERRFSARYRLQDDAALARYLRDEAPRLREDGARRFGTRFRATRRVLHPPATS